MEKYQYSAEKREALESLINPLAVFQYVDQTVVTLALSEGFIRLLGYRDRAEATHAMDHDMYGKAHPDDRERLAGAVLRFARDDEQLNVVYRTRQGMASDYRVLHIRGKHVLTETGARVSHVWFMDEGVYVEGEEDTGTQLNRILNSALHEESIMKAARFDELTGLPNLACFFKLCEKAKSDILRAGKTGILLYMDLNGMKYFNQRYGFAEGDKLLTAFTEILTECFGRDCCCHAGGDRFTVYTTSDLLGGQLEKLTAKAEKMNGGRCLPVRIGVYSTDIEDVPASSAYDRAKMACDAIRKSDVTEVNHYSEELRTAARRRQYIITNIDRAVGEGWITVYYQPIVRAVNEKICDEEALARWIDPEEGFLSPADFIPLLEDAGLIYKLDLCVLDQVLAKLNQQRAEGMELVPQSINLSRVDFDACDIVEEIRKRVDEAGIERKLITVELTESVIGSDIGFMNEQVGRFRELGFPVWMDDFGSGYSSMDVLRSIRFDLIKFDMSLLRKLDEDDSGKVILTELMKMATSLGLDTVCEGVETESQVLFLQEIGCSKLQGFFFGRPSSLEQIRQRYDHGLRLGFEDPAASSYYESIGRISLYDLDVIAAGNEDPLQNAFNTLPMAILEIRGDTVRYLRTNPSYRRFINRFFDFDLSMLPKDYVRFASPFMMNIVTTCSKPGARAFFNEKMGDGSVVHSFARWIALNPASGDIAVAVAVLSVSDPGLEESYADIARALAADYYNIYVVDLDTEDFIEYSSPVGGDTLSVERHGAGFFESVRRDTMTRIYEDDRKLFLTWFNKENVMKELAVQGLFTTTYRLIDSGEPVYAALKVTRMRGTNKIILGVSIIDSQMKQQEQMRTD